MSAAPHPPRDVTIPADHYDELVVYSADYLGRLSAQFHTPGTVFRLGDDTGRLLGEAWRHDPSQATAAFETYVAALVGECDILEKEPPTSAQIHRELAQAIRNLRDRDLDTAAIVATLGRDTRGM